MRPRRWIATAAWLLWLYLAFVAATGWMRARPEKSLEGAWQHGARRIEFRADGSVSSAGQTSKLVTWQGSRLLFDEQELTASLRDHGPDDTRWDFLLARQCGLVLTSDNDCMGGPHVSHKTVGHAIEATAKWDHKDHWTLDSVCYERVQTEK